MKREPRTVTVRLNDPHKRMARFRAAFGLRKFDLNESGMKWVPGPPAGTVEHMAAEVALGLDEDEVDNLRYLVSKAVRYLVFKKERIAPSDIPASEERAAERMGFDLELVERSLEAASRKKVRRSHSVPPKTVKARTAANHEQGRLLVWTATRKLRLPWSAIGGPTILMTPGLSWTSGGRHAREDLLRRRSPSVQLVVPTDPAMESTARRRYGRIRSDVFVTFTHAGWFHAAYPDGRVFRIPSDQR